MILAGIKTAYGTGEGPHPCRCIYLPVDPSAASWNRFLGAFYELY